MRRSFVLLLLLHAACSRSFTVPGPVLYVEDAHPYEHVPENLRTNKVQVFYATDREPVPDADPADRYNDTRGQDLRIGRATVRLGDEGASWGEIQRRTLEGGKLRSHLVKVEEFGPVGGKSTDTFVTAVNGQLRHGRGDVFVFIPGYNTHFEWPVTISGQFRHHTGRRGVFVSYCWPARGPWLTYVSDRATATASVPRLRALLDLIAKTNAERIHLMGYSFGAMMVADLLERLAADESPAARRTREKLGHAVYAAADVDLKRFRALHLAPDAPHPMPFSAYTHNGDCALFLVGVCHLFATRVGRANGDLTAADQERLIPERQSAYIDVSNAVSEAGGGFLNHQYFHQNGWVMTDLLLTTFYALPPARRGLVRGKGEALWRFPDDYPARVQALAREHGFFLGNRSR